MHWLLFLVTETHRLFTLAADQGLGNAQVFLSDMYAKGNGVRKDHLKCCQLLALAVEQGCPLLPEGALGRVIPALAAHEVALTGLTEAGGL
jgi:hypothetical protein